MQNGNAETTEIELNSTVRGNGVEPIVSIQCWCAIGSILSPIGAKHRLENRRKIRRELIEVHFGEHLEEDDIEWSNDSCCTG